MPRKKKRSYIPKLNLQAISENIEEETRHSILAIIFFLVGVFLVLASLGYAGSAGSTIYGWLVQLFGVGYALLPTASLLFAYSLYKVRRPNVIATNVIVITIFLLSGLGLMEILGDTFDRDGYGGLVGKGLSTFLIGYFDVYISALLFIALITIAVLVLLNVRLPGFGRARDDERDTVVTGYTDEEELVDEDEEEEEEEYEDEEGDEAETDTGEEAAPIPAATFMRGKFKAPPLSLLNRDSGKPGVGDIKANANIIKRTLQNFGINVEIDEVSVGPSITRYALKPAEGVRISRITALQNDLSLALAAHPLRVEAPIPGKSLVGIEIPNSRKTTVGLASLLSSKDFSDPATPLIAGVGRGVTGIPKFANLAKLPHLLIAGTTGAGKSVTLHALVVSLLYKNPPENLRFIMIDPKRVELTLYNSIPHLLTPVITDPKKAILALKWAIKEMERRYNILEEESVRDIQSYHANVLEPAYSGKKTPEDPPEDMPYIVIIMDEIADIMSRYPRELEAAVVRLAQMSRAVGIHLILSTQRPSVNVITGLIKANVPARIALQVSSQIDSRTILDMAGAEKLLGAGDLLYLSGEMSKPVRLQSAFISEGEVKKVVQYFKKHYGDMESEDLSFEDANGRDTGMAMNLEDNDGEDEDDLYEEAKETVIAAGRASTSFLQRKLRVGYARAARLIDMLEERGVVGPGEGAKPREVYGAQEEGDEEYEEEE